MWENVTPPAYIDPPSHVENIDEDGGDGMPIGGYDVIFLDYSTAKPRTGKDLQALARTGFRDVNDIFKWRVLRQDRPSFLGL